MGVKFAHALGAHVVAVHDLGEQGARTPRGSAPMRSSFRKNADSMAARANSFDFILDTVAVSHDLDPYIETAEARRHDGAGRRAGDAASARSQSVNLIFGGARMSPAR